VANPDEIRHELTVLAKRKEGRALGFPRDWSPGRVRNPETGEPFTEAGAWWFIAEKLEQGHPLEEIAMDDCPGTHGYVMEVDVGREVPLYIKLQRGSGKVIGRSFHYSKRSELDKE
jgi:hypothetical protein